MEPSVVLLFGLDQQDLLQVQLVLELIVILKEHYFLMMGLAA